MCIQINNSPLIKRRLFQILATLTGTLGIITDGMHFGWSSPVLPILRNATITPLTISSAAEQWLEHIYMIGSICGLPVTIFCVNKFGRKSTILLAGMQHIIAWFLIGSTYSVEVLYVARFLAGLAGDVAYVSAPMYIGEIAEPDIRGALSAVIHIMLLIGIVLVYSIAPFVSILTSSAIAAVFPILQLLTFSFMPESPYYLLLKNKRGKAMKSLQRLRSSDDVSAELEEIAAAVKRQSSEKGRPIDIILIDSNRKALIIMLALNAAQQFSGSCVFTMNIHTILSDAASILPATTAGIIFSVIMVLASTVAALFVDKAGRKSLLISSSLLSGACLLTLALYFTFKNSGHDITSVNWIPVVAVMTFAAVFKCGLGLVPIIMTAELFPTSVKALGMTIADGSLVVFSLGTLISYSALVKFGLHWLFYIFSSSCILISIFAMIYVPETKGKSLEEIQLMLKGIALDDVRNNEIYELENLKAAKNSV